MRKQARSDGELSESLEMTLEGTASSKNDIITKALHVLYSSAGVPLPKWQVQRSLENSFGTQTSVIFLHGFGSKTILPGSFLGLHCSLTKPVANQVAFFRYHHIHPCTFLILKKLPMHAHTVF